MTMKGTGSDNVFYTSSARFQSAQVGIGIPLFFGAQKAKINAGKIGESIAENNYLIALQELEKDYFSSFVRYASLSRSVNYFESVGLKNAALISSTANEQFSKGEINYLEWNMLNNQAISIQNDYYDLLRGLNQSIIQLNYLSTK